MLIRELRIYRVCGHKWATASTNRTMSLVWFDHIEHIHSNLFRFVCFVLCCAVLWASFNMHLNCFATWFYDRCNVQKPILTRPIHSVQIVSTAFSLHFCCRFLVLCLYDLLLLACNCCCRCSCCCWIARESVIVGKFLFTSFIQFCLLFRHSLIWMCTEGIAVLIIPTVNRIKAIRKRRTKASKANRTNAVS